MPEDGTAEAPGQVGPYLLRELLGQGGMGEVWRAADTVREREVALKLIIGSSSSDPALAARFRRECRLAARLSSAHVVPIHDFGEIEGRLFLDMRLVPGPDLRTVLDRNPDGIDPEAVRDVIVQVADALDSAHEQELVHRDVKPSNVLIDASRGRWFCYLADFGVAVPFDAAPDTRITRTGTTIGTPAYMAPEMLTGDGRASVSSDVYALGCLLYELLTGRPPYSGANEAAVLYAHAHADPPSPSTHRPWLGGFDAVVRAALAKDPSRRYGSAGELARSLPVRPAGPTPPRAPSAPTLVGEPEGPGRHRRGPVLVVALALLLVLGLGAGGYAWLHGPGPSAVPAPVAAPPVPTSVASRLLRGFPTTYGVASTSDGRSVDVVAQDSLGQSLFVLDPTSGEVVDRIPVDPSTTSVVVNRDGSRAYLAATGSDDDPGSAVQVLDVPNRRAIGTVSVGGRPLFATLSPDGSRLYVTTRAAAAGKPGALVTIDTSRNVVVSTVPVGVVPNGVAISPDGGRAYVVDSDDRPSLTVVDTATGRVERTVPTGPAPYDVRVSPDGRTLYVSTNTGSAPATIDEFDTGSFGRTEIPAPTSSYPIDIALSPDGTRLLMLNFGTDQAPGRTVTILDTTRGTAFPTAQLGGRSGQISITPDGHHAFVTTYGDTGGVWALDFP